MAEIKLQRTAYRFRSASNLYIKIFPLLLLVGLASLIRPEFFTKLKIAWLESLTLTEVDPGKHELSSLRDINVLGFFSNLRLTSYEVLLLTLLLLTLLLSVVLLSCVWFVRFKLRLFYNRCCHKEGTPKFGEFVTNHATHVFVNELVLDTSCLETVNRRNRVLVPLYRTGFIFYLHDYKKFVFNTANNRFEPVEHIDDIDVAKVKNWQGLLTVSDGVTSKCGLEPNLNVCADLYGPNDYEIPRCNFWKMLFEAFLAPFFVFQVTSTLLWIFDDYLYYSLISIFSMILIEVQMVYKRIMEYNRINSMTLPPYYVHAYRDNKWQPVLTNQLYPGDIIMLSTTYTHNLQNVEDGKAGKQGKSAKPRAKAATGAGGSENILICPCDCLILEGEVIVDESILTGESIPQFKTSAEEDSKNQRNSTIFSGTTIILTRNPNSGSAASGKGNTPARAGDKLTSDGCVCLVIRTGFESYQGRLVHSILHSDPNMVVNSNKQGYLFLLLLLLFAVGAVWIVVKNSNYKSIKKLLLVSSRILVSVIPPEFPVTLSMAVTIGLIQLRRKGIYCTEPNRLPLAATIDVIAFDKTGTLTQDQMYLNGLYYTNSFQNYVHGSGSDVGKDHEAGRVESLQETPEVKLLYWYSKLVIAGCHSLTYVNEKVTGDPMEKIPFNHFNNKIDPTNNNTVFLGHGVGSMDASETRVGSSEKMDVKEMGKNGVVKILKRWRFTSELGRMSVLAQVSAVSEAEGTPGDRNRAVMKDETLLLVKGSPEKIKSLLRVVPVYFDGVCHELTLKGLRVLCLAYKKLYDIPASALVTIDRSIVEKDLEFSGFVALEAPIKNSSKICMRRLRGHKQIMITGDNILTACHVTEQINLDGSLRSKSHFNMDYNKGKWGFLSTLSNKLFGKEDRSKLTVKDYLKNYHLNMVDECPLSGMSMDTFKKCPVYTEKTSACPFLGKPKKEIQMHIQRCPLKQSIASTYSSGGASSQGSDMANTTVQGSNQGSSESAGRYKELYNRNSYKKFIESCPVNVVTNHANPKCPLSKSDPDLTSLLGQASTSSRKDGSKSKGGFGCPIKFTKRLVKGFKITMIKVLFPSYYYTYHVDPFAVKEGEFEEYGTDNFGILSHYRGNFTWKRRNGEDFFPNSTNDQIIQNMYRLLPNHKLCITGTALEHLMLNANTAGDPESTRTPTPTSANTTKTPASTTGSPTLKNWTMNEVLLIISNCTVFARMSPQQKEFIIKCFKLDNRIVAMCGDGTNDVAALKQAHIGLSLLNTIKTNTLTDPLALRRSRLQANLTDDLPSIKLGEASIASPFTYHGSDINCVFNLVKSGRCALSNVFMLYKLMGINSLITALGMSILALDGVNFSDAQTTLYSVLYTYLVLALSKSRPSDIPSEKKPSRSIFSPSNFLSLMAQIAVHAFFLLFVWNLGKAYRSPDYRGYLDAPFEPNIVNTLVYYVWYGINLSSFISNYIDYPYLESITSNKYLFKPIVVSFSLLLMFMSDVVGPLNRFFSLVRIHDYVLKIKVVSVIALDLVLTFVVSKVINHLLA